MEYQNLEVSEKDGVTILTVSREKALNALNRLTFTEIDHFFSETIHQLTTAGVVVTGAGEKAFVAGADIKEFFSLKGEDAKMLSKRGQDIFFKVEQSPKPVVAAVNGFALGGGCELAMACHMRIASEKARFGLPEVSLGIIPGYGGTQRLVQLIGKGKAMEYTLTGDMMDAQTALQLGLVNHVVPHGEELDKAIAIIHKTRDKGPLALAAAIKCINDHFDENKNGFASEYTSFGEIALTEDFIEGATAFTEKRKAAFKGK